MVDFIFRIIEEVWHILLDSSFYMLIGIGIAGLLNIFLSTAFIVRHLGKGRFSTVFKAAFLGVPLPL